MSQKPVIKFSRPSLFGRSVSENTLNLAGTAQRKTLADLEDSNIENSSSFRYDPPETGLKNSQQLNVDWSKFENHTFFNSAEAKVNIAFDKVINEYPFDGTKKEIEAFFDSLIGFEKWVYDKFPKNKGFLFFSGTQTTEGLPTRGTYIIVPDFIGNSSPTLSKNTTGKSILDPGYDPLAIEMHIYLPTIANDNQVIAQKLSGSNSGFTLAISQSSSTTNCNLVFGITSASFALSSSAQIQKGQFNHICAEFSRATNTDNLKLFINRELVGTSSKSSDFGLIDFTTSDLIIGSGTVHNLIGGGLRQFVPNQTLSGALDEFRFFHSQRTIQQQKSFAKKGIFASPELKLYFKFNEPTGSIGAENIVLDSSGNSLHSEISNYVHTIRNTGSISSPMTFEKMEYNPILFPKYVDVRNLNADLLFSASLYDEKNPNLITKLIPKHYILEGQYQEAFKDEDGTIGDSYSGEGIPGSGKIGSAQLLVSFLYIWAKYFDEIKLFVEHFGNLMFVNYDDKDHIADQFLPFLAKQFGLEIPGLFQNSEIEQFIDAENISREISTQSISLQYIQNQIWRRILTNYPHILKSKGTLESVKGLLRSLGVNPDNNLRIREYGGKKEGKISEFREQKHEIGAVLDFSGTVAQTNGSVNSIGVPLNKPFIFSGFLSASRTEVGFPEKQGTFVNSTPFLIHGVSNNTDDGLLTSGSWTYEAIYKFNPLFTGSHLPIQSLVRMNTTGTASPASLNAVLANLVAVSGSLTGSLKFFARPVSGSTAPALELLLTGVNLFDGNKWNISFGRQRNDEINSIVSSSYFLRAARNDFGKITEIYSTSSYFLESADGLFANNLFQNIFSTINSSGIFLTIGSQSINNTQPIFLHDTTTLPNNETRATEFSGKVGQIRFWSKALSFTEWKEHIKNYKSVGTINALDNFNFERNSSGSFEKLRLDVSTDQPVTQSNSSGQIEIFDFSQNHFHFSGSGFEPSKQTIKTERFDYSFISPKFDEAISSNKVRPRSFLQEKNATEYDTDIAPKYEIDRNQEPMDDTRFSIEFSLINALNEDIINIFATLDQIENAIGDPELLFSPDYPKLEDLRKLYFNRLEKKINLKDLFAFFKWFDGFVGTTSLIEKMLPRKTKFFGINFVIENHMLERFKKEYRFFDQYLETRKIDSNRADSLSVIVKK